MRKVFIIEQNQQVRDALTRALGEDGGDVTLAADSEAVPPGEAAVIHLAQRGEQSAAADQVLYKPLRLGALRDSIRQLGNRSARAADLAVGKNFVLLSGSQKFKSKATGWSVKLTDKEEMLIRHLVNAGPDGLERRALLDLVWGYAAGVETHTLETHIYRLRQKIEADPAQPEILLTTATGYRIGGAGKPA